MAQGPRFVSLFIVMVFVISVVPTAMATETSDDPVDQDWYSRMLEWAAEQPRQYTDDGMEVPIDGTAYFLESGFPVTTSSRGSRTLNACGSGYNSEGSGAHAYLLIKNGDANYPNATKRQEILDEFDDIIWPNDITIFGGISTSMIDICVYTMDGAGGLGGYFAGGDNIWVDAADMNGWGYQIMAHEFQHLIHSQHDANEELWLNEGNSDLAIVMCYGGQASGVMSHVMAFEQVPDNDLTQFDNQGYDYGSSLVYILYVWEHYGGNGTINHLVNNAQNGISSVTSTLTAKGHSDSGTEVFYRFAVANIMDDTSFDSGKWGYDEISIEVHSTSHTIYPASGNGNVNDWAADYYTFTNTGDIQNLEVSFNGGSGNFRAYLGMEGRGGNESKVQQIPLDGSNDGEYTVENFGTFGTYNKVHLIIAASNSGGSYSFDADLVDMVPPITNLNVNPVLPNGPDGWYTTKPTITMSTNEPAATIYYHWDSEPDQIYSQGFQPPEGEHTIYYHAVDSSNNIELERGHSLKVDSVDPVTTMTVDPAASDGEDDWYVTAPTITFKSSEAGTIYYKWNDDGTFAQYTGSITAPEGINKVHFYAEDLRGNAEKAQFHDLKVDTVVPTTTVNITPESATGLDGWYTAPPTVTMASDADATIMFRWDTEPETEYLGDIIATEGEHVLHYYSKDLAGNVEPERTMTVKVDTVVPQSVMTIDPFEPDGENEWYVTTPIVVMSLEGDLSASIHYKYDDEEEFTHYEEEFEVPDGAHTLYWYAIDPAGNKEAEHAEEINVDTTVPVTTLKVTPDKGESEWYTELPVIEFERSEEEALIFYHWDYERPIQLTSTLLIPEGRHVLYYYAVDDAGNMEDEKSRELRIDTQRPVAILSVPTTGDEGKAVTMDGSSSKDSNDVVSYHFDFGDGQDSGWISSPTTTHTYKKDGTFTVTLTVKDRAGLESNPQSSQIKIKKKQTGGGGIFDPEDPDDPDAELPFYKKSIDIAGMSFPFWLLLLLLLVIIAVIVAVAVAARRRSKRRREAKVRDLERDIDERWRPRREEDMSYDEGPALRATEPYTFGYPSYETDADDVEAVQMTEPYDPGPEPEVKRWTPPAAATSPVDTGPGPAPVFEPVEEPEPPKPEVAAAPPVAKAKAVKKAEPAVKSGPKPEPKVAETKPEPGPKKEKKGDDIDLDSEISDILSRLNM